MRPLSTRIQNLYSHADSFLNLRNKKLSLIVGEVDDEKDRSNTAGKTSVFNAMEFVMFGSTRAGLDRIIRDGCNEGNGSLIFQGDDGNVYKIDRTAKRASNGRVSTDVVFHYASNGRWVRKDSETEKGSRAIQKEIEKVIGMDAEVFRHSVWLQQQDVGAFAKSDPSERRTILKKFIDLSVWDELQEAAKIRSDTTKLELDNIKTIVDDLSSRVEDPEPIKEKVLLIEKDILSDQESHVSQNGLIADFDKRLTGLKETDKLGEKVVSLQKEVRTAKNLVDQIDRNISDLKKDFNDEVAEFRESAQKEPELIEKKEKLTLSVSEAPGFEIQLKENAQKISSVRECISEHEKSVAVYQAQVSGIVEQGKTIQKLKGQCPTCWHEIGEEYKTCVIDQLKEQLAITKKGRDEGKSVIDTKNEELKNLLKIDSDINLKIRSMFQKKSELDSVNNSLDRLSKERERLKRKKQEVYDKKTKLEESKSEYIIQLQKLDEQVVVATEKFNKAKQDSENSEKLKNSRKAAVDELERLGRRILSLQKQLGEFHSRLAVCEKMRKEIFEKKEKSDQLHLFYNIKKQVEKSFGKSGIQALILENSITCFESTTRSYLKRFTQDKYDIKFETFTTNKTNDNVREVLNILINKGNGIWHPYESFSGSETMKIDLALRVGMAMCAASFNSVRPEYLYIDEVAGSLDAYGRKLFLEMLVELSGDFDLILVVTHFPELQEEFSNIITVKKTGFVSTIIDADKPEKEDLFSSVVEKKKPSSKKIEVRETVHEVDNVFAL